MKKLLSIILSCLLCAITLTSCKVKQPEQAKFSHALFGYFDTAISVVSYQNSQEDFDNLLESMEQQYKHLNNLFDIYNDYEGLNNIKTINDQAGVAPVVVDKEIIDLLKFSIDWYNKSNGKVNVAMGSVLKIWHDVRSLNNPEEIEIPNIVDLKQANEHTDIADIQIDETNSTVFLKDSKMSLDVGAVAKGYATELIAQNLAQTYDNFAISAGGNVRTHGAPKDGRTRWGVGIENPALDENFMMIGGNTDLAFINGNQSIVCSGGYQRFFVKEGVKYHHLIDPDTLYPENYYQGVSILCENSGDADALSTAVFMMDIDTAYEFISSLENTECIFVLADGTVKKTDGFNSYLKSAGITATTP